MKMQLNPRARRASTRQKHALLDYLEMNPKLALQNTREWNEQWNQLASTLNALDGADKIGMQWKRYWMDLRRNTQRRLHNLKRRNNNSTRTIVNPNLCGNFQNAQTLTDEDKRILKIGKSKSKNLSKLSLYKTKLNDKRTNSRDNNTSYRNQDVITTRSPHRSLGEDVFTNEMDPDQPLEPTNYLNREHSSENNEVSASSDVPIKIKTEPGLLNEAVNDEGIKKGIETFIPVAQEPAATVCNYDSYDEYGSEQSHGSTMTAYEREMLKLKREELEVLKKYKSDKTTTMKIINTNLENIFSFLKKKL